MAYLADYNFPLTFIDNALHDFNYDVNYTTTELPDIYLKTVEQPKLGYLKLPKGGCSGAKYVALIKTSYQEYQRRAMMRKMFKSQLKDDEYDLFFLIGFRINPFHKNFAHYQNITSQELVEKDSAIMKEFHDLNDLGKIFIIGMKSMVIATYINFYYMFQLSETLKTLTKTFRQKLFLGISS